MLPDALVWQVLWEVAQVRAPLLRSAVSCKCRVTDEHLPVEGRTQSSLLRSCKDRGINERLAVEERTQSRSMRWHACAGAGFPAQPWRHSHGHQTGQHLLQPLRHLPDWRLWHGCSEQPRLGMPHFLQHSSVLNVAGRPEAPHSRSSGTKQCICSPLSTRVHTF